MDQGQFQGEVLAKLETLGREMHEMKIDVGQNRAAIADVRVEIAKKNGNGMKRKIGVASLFVAAGGGIGYMLAALIRGLLETLPK